MLTQISQAVIDYRNFLRVMSSGLNPDERIVIDQVPGDPGENENMVAAKFDRIYHNPSKGFDDLELLKNRNLYLCVMAVLAAPRNKRSRRREAFSCGMALVIDDVGDVNVERGIKVPKDLLSALKPTALVETSEGNFQAWYRLTNPIRDSDFFDRMIRAFIQGKLMGKDPGQSGIARIVRIPFGINGKPSRNGWQVRLEELNEDVSYTPGELIRAFGLTLDPPAAPIKASDDVVSVEVWKYNFFKKHLESADRNNERYEDRRGEWKVVCPNWWSHSNGVKSGTTVFYPGRNTRKLPYTIFSCSHGCKESLKTGAALKMICQNDPDAYAEWRKFWDDREKEEIAGYDNVDEDFEPEFKTGEQA